MHQASAGQVRMQSGEAFCRQLNHQSATQITSSKIVRSFSLNKTSMEWSYKLRIIVSFHHEGK